MNTTFLKNISLSLGTLLVSSQILAIEDLDKRISKLETQMNQVSTETALGTYGAKSGTANPSVESGVFLYGDLLYWHVYEGSAYNYTQIAEFSAIEIIQNTPGKTSVEENSNSDINEDARHVNFRWDFGFKAGIGYQLPHDDWDARAEFTYFRTKGSDAQSEFLPIIQKPYSFTNSQDIRTVSGNVAIKSTKTEWKLDFYNINLTLGRNYFISQSLSLHPFAGIQTAWIRQNLSLNYFTTENQNAVDQAEFTIIGSYNYNESFTNRRKNRFWGIGPRFGFDTKWYLNKSVGIYGTVAGGIIWGEFDVTKKFSPTGQLVVTVENFVAQDIDTFVTSKIVSHPHRIVANAQLDLGVSWEFFFTSSDSHLELRAGYENQYWWRQNYVGVDTLTTPDDLGFHGGLFEAKFDF